jgi:predicted transcriptional regulator
MTKREMFTALLNLNEVAARPDLVAGIEHEIDLLSRKNASTRKPTAHQEENDMLIEKIVNVLFRAPETGMTVTEIAKALNNPDLTHSRINQLVKKLKDNGTVIREEVKRRAYFRLSEEAMEGLAE